MFQTNINKDAEVNSDFRQVVCTGKYSQLVLMCLQPNEDIGTEVHESTDQIFFFVKGTGQAEVDSDKSTVHAGDCVMVPAGTSHNISNIGSEMLKLITVYAPPAHMDGVVHKTKEDAMEEEKY